MNITLHNISKAYNGKDIFSDFSLDIVDGMRLCICGPNGCGKSTLLRIMAGHESPDHGRVIFPKGCRVGYVEQILDDKDLDTPLLTWVLDVLPDWHDFWQAWEAAHGDEAALATLMERQHDLEARYGYNPEQKAQAVLSGLGFSRRKQEHSLGQLSGGWRERAKLARVLTAGADVLLLDEPTNHLDMEAVEWLEDFLLDYKGVLVFVAHDRVFMDRMGTHVLYLGMNKPLFRKTSFSKFIEMQDELEEQREREAKRLTDEIEHKMDFVRRFGAKATKARQATSRARMAKKLEKELENYQPEQKRKELSFKWPEAAKSEKVVASVTNLTFSFPDGKTLWPALTFSLFRGQRIALVGHNGCGKSTLLKLINGILPRSGGTITLSPTTRMGYYSQQQTDILNTENTALGEMRRLSDPKTTEEELMSVMGLFLLGQGYFDRKVGVLSGGERSRLALGLLFLARCNLLVLDEPTNHLDLESREALIEALNTYEGTLFMVAHDRHLLAEVADEIWEMTDQGITVYEEGFAQYNAARKSAKLSAKQESASLPSTGLSREDLKRLKREQAEQRNALYKQLKPLQAQYESQEKALEKILNRLSEVESLLASPEVYNDGSQASALLKEFHELQRDSDTQLNTLELLENQIKVLETARAALTLDGGEE